MNPHGEISLYGILQVRDYCEIPEIKKAYRSLALKYHPDRNNDTGAPEMFRKLNEAYQVLGNPESKIRYDTYLSTGMTYTGFVIPEATDIRKERMKWYIRYRQEADAREDVENVARYEKWAQRFPVVWRLILLSITIFTGTVYISTSWFQRGSKIFAGIVILFVSLLMLWNELYKKEWYQKAINSPGTRQNSKKRERSAALVRNVFLSSILLIIVMVNLKKAIHLKFFGKVIEAVAETNDHSVHYQYGNYQYSDKVFFLPEGLEKDSVIFIRISTTEPEIWEYYP